MLSAACTESLGAVREQAHLKGVQPVRVGGSSLATPYSLVGMVNEVPEGCLPSLAELLLVNLLQQNML